ncbi:MAG: hypothetical protein IRZ05_16850 [Micromonosporaceae bacterium]|nr:hypothetical protein [Micromonosporaceae bacterium]
MWLCWIATTVVAVFLYVLWLVLFLLSVALVAICWKTCILAFFLNFGKATFNCIAGDPTPTPTPTPPPPSVSIAAPTTGTYFPDGDTVAITFRATATEPDGTPLAGSALLWERYLGTFPPTYDRLGTGTEIAVTLPHLPVDVAAGQPSSHTVRVTATGRNGVKADTDVHVSVGHIQID